MNFESPNAEVRTTRFERDMRDIIESCSLLEVIDLDAQVFSPYVYEADPEEAGIFIKQLVETLTSPNRPSYKKLYQTVLLPSTNIKLKELVIARPITLKGRPGTTLEITHGSILVDFELGQDLTGTMEKVN